MTSLLFKSNICHANCEVLMDIVNISLKKIIISWFEHLLSACSQQIRGLFRLRTLSNVYD